MFDRPVQRESSAGRVRGSPRVERECPVLPAFARIYSCSGKCGQNSEPNHAKCEDIARVASGADKLSSTPDRRDEDPRDDAVIAGSEQHSGMRLGGRAGAGRARSTPWLIRVPSRHDSSPPHLSDCGQARERVCAANRGNRFKLACIKGFRALCNGFAIAMPGSDRASDPSKPGVCHTERLYVEARMISTPVASIRKRARTSRRSSQGSGRTRSMSRIAGRLSSSGRRSGR